MTTMRQRVALAICQNAILNCCWRATGENVEASKKCASCGSAASAVLKAMRDPTEMMTECGNKFVNLHPSDRQTIPAAWNAMIDGALREREA